MSVSSARVANPGMLLEPSELRELAVATFEEPLLSIYARTDPRDAANASPPYAWEIELRNALRDIASSVAEHKHARDQFAALQQRVEARIAALDGSGRGRSFAWIIAADGTDVVRLEGLHLPFSRTTAVWDDRPYLAPLADLSDRATPAGVILVGGEELRLVEWRNGTVDLSAPLVFELELGDWRDFRTAARPNPVRGQTSVSHLEHYDARVDKQRAKLYERAAHAAAERARTLDWERVVVVGEGQHLATFRHALPTELAGRVIDAIDHNAAHDNVAALDALIGPRLEREWRERTVEAVQEMHEHARAGGPGALGADEVFGALAEGRVAHLVIDPAHDFSDAAAGTMPERPADDALVAERAIRAAIATGARVSALAQADCDALASANGMAALLRY